MLFRKMLRETKSNFGQFFSIFLLSAIALMCYVGFEANVIGGRNALKEFNKDTNVADGWLYGEAFDETDLEKVKGLSFVTDAQLRMSIKASAKDYDDAQVDLYLMDESCVNKIAITEGKEFDAVDLDGIWISKVFADKRGLKVGDSFTVTYNGVIFTKTIRGLGESAEYAFRQADKDPDISLENITFAYMSYDAFPIREYAKHLIETEKITVKMIMDKTDVLDQAMSDEKLKSLMPFSEMIIRVDNQDALSYEDEIAKV